MHTNDLHVIVPFSFVFFPQPQQTLVPGARHPWRKDLDSLEREGALDRHACRPVQPRLFFEEVEDGIFRSLSSFPFHCSPSHSSTFPNAGKESVRRKRLRQCGWTHAQYNQLFSLPRRFKKLCAHPRDGKKGIIVFLLQTVSNSLLRTTSSYLPRVSRVLPQCHAAACWCYKQEKKKKIQTKHRCHNEKITNHQPYMRCQNAKRRRFKKLQPPCRLKVILM